MSFSAAITRKPKIEHRGHIKQIMTGLEGNRQLYLPREIQDCLPMSFNRIFWGGDPESQGANRQPIT